MQEMQETQVRSLGQEDPLEEKMATHSTIPAWEIPWTEEPGRLQSMGSQKSQTQLSTHAHTPELEVWSLNRWTTKESSQSRFQPMVKQTLVRVVRLAREKDQ